MNRSTLQLSCVLLLCALLIAWVIDRKHQHEVKHEREAAVQRYLAEYRAWLHSARVNEERRMADAERWDALVKQRQREELADDLYFATLKLGFDRARAEAERAKFLRGE